MSSNSIKLDTCNTKKNLYQSTQPLNYILNTPKDTHRYKNNRNLAIKDNNIRGINCIKEYDVNKNLRFNNPTRINNDKCLITTEDKQNINMGVYTLSNFHQCACGAPQVAEVAHSEPSIYYRDGYGNIGLDGCNVDADSILRNGQLITKSKCPTQLNVRPHLTKPYMGRGTGNPCVESILQTGEDTSQKKQCNTLSGYENSNQSLLVPCIAKNIQNPRNLIPEVADKDWIRGGLPSRQLKQNSNFLRRYECI